MPPLKITVATVCYNAGPLIATTIESVAAQTYADVEHLIIDGNSSDDTLQQIHRYQAQNSVSPVAHEIVCISEPDEGLYDAMNKALDQATGDYILFLNAGDAFHSPDTLAHVAALAAQYERRPAVIYGDTDLVDGEGHFIRNRRLTPPAHLGWRDFRNGMLVCHQAFFASLDLARQIHYDRRYRLSADFDWCIRILRSAEHHKLPVANLHEVVADYLSEGLSTRHHGASLRERFDIMVRHYGLFRTLWQHAWFVIRAVVKK